METNFFSQLSGLNIKGIIKLTIAISEGPGITVSTFIDSDHCGDEARHQLIPYKLSGTAAELDNGYFERIVMPLQSTSGLLDNMENYMKQQEVAKQRSAMEKEKADKEKKEKEEKEKRFKEAMKKADELENEGKHREAWTKLPEPSDYPEHADTIRKRRQELADKFSAPSLF